MSCSGTIESLNQELGKKSAEEILSCFLERYKGKIALSSSMGVEDQVLTHMIARIDKNARIFTLDTGRMFPETYDLIDRTNKRYKINIEIFFPDTKQVEGMVREKGINLFYESIENRKLCCNIRKIEPLKRAMKGLEIWISGIRRDQSVTRQEMKLVEWDELHGIMKVNPLIDWTEEETWGFVKENNIPYNPMHDQGFPSIGCRPCTRAVEPGEDVRAGRWWWENPDDRECGLHKNLSK